MFMRETMSARNSRGSLQEQICLFEMPLHRLMRRA